MKAKTGDMIVILSLLTTVGLWLLFQFRLEEFPSLILVQLNQITALLGTILLSWSMVLVTRLNFLERLFNGLDNVYKMHKKVSIWGMVLIAAHIVFLATQRIPNLEKAVGMFFPIHRQVYINLGAWSFWLFVFFITITLLMKKIKLPYHTWKHTHKITGIALILAFLHIVLIPGNITSSPIFNLWLLLTTGTGIASWIYFEFLYKLLTPSYSYRVTEILKHGDIFKIKLIPQDKKMLYKPGQFVYLSFTNSKVCKEMHPFTITSHPDDNELSFAIKILGDYTSTLDKLQIGNTARVWGPYGNFADEFLNSNKDSVFIGGGIGMAPFMSMIKEARKKQASGRRVNVFYCTKYKCEACFDKEFTKYTDVDPNISYINKCPREKGRLTITEISDRIRDIKNTLVFMCGPDRMAKPLKENLIAHGFLKTNIISENFDLL